MGKQPGRYRRWWCGWPGEQRVRVLVEREFAQGADGSGPVELGRTLGDQGLVEPLDR